MQVSFGNNDKLTDGKSFINRDDLSFLGSKVISKRFLGDIVVCFKSWIVFSDLRHEGYIDLESVTC